MNSPQSLFGEAVTEGGTSHETPDFKQYIIAIRKYFWRIVLFSALISSLAYLIAKELTPIYIASTSVVMQKKAPKMLSYMDMYAFMMGQNEYLVTQVELLKSKPVVEHALNTLGLFDQSDLLLKKSNISNKSLQIKSSVLAYFQPLLDTIGNNNTGSETAIDEQGLIETQVIQDEQLISFVQNNIIANPLRKSSVVKLSVSLPDPTIAASLANQLIKSHIDLNYDTRFANVEKSSDWVEQRVGDIKTELEASEQALEEYRKQKNIIEIEGSGSSSLALQRLKELSPKLVSAKSKLNELGFLYKQAQGFEQLPLDQLLNIPSIYNNPAIQEVKSRELIAIQDLNKLTEIYGPKHPKLIRAHAELDSLQAKYKNMVPGITKKLKSDLDVSRGIYSALKKENDSLESKLRKANTLEFDLDKLKRNVESNKKLHQLFIEERQQTNLVGSFESNYVHIIERAFTPASPEKPDIPKIVLAALFLSLLLAIGLAILLEVVNQTFRNAESIESNLGIPLLGSISTLTKQELIQSKGSAEVFYRSAISNSFSESIRDIRTGISLSSLDTPHRTIMITSSVPEEGKTTIAFNLALSMSRMERTLLIDADLRRPSICRVTKTLGKLGLSELMLNSDLNLTDIIQEYEDTSLSILGSGKTVPDPLKLFSSKRFQALLARLSQHYDRIIIDTPPVNNVSDSSLIATMMDAVVFVTRYDNTNTKTAKKAISKLNKVKAPLIGAVLNQADLDSMSKYYGYEGEYEAYSQNPLELTG